ncbi:MAG: DUF6799 domain-containing protein [Ferruginibacter sp.]
MKTKKMMLAALLMFSVCFINSNAYSQVKTDTAMMKDCCMMKDGKMMLMKAGKPMPMDHDMTMKNGTKCMVNGECIMKSGTKMKMKEGQCMDMDGKMDQCPMMNKKMKSAAVKKSKSMAVSYTCPMHPEVISDKPGKCPKCGMALIKKK